MAKTLKDYVGTPFKDIPKEVIDAAEKSGELDEYSVNDVDGSRTRGNLEHFDSHGFPEPEPVSTPPPTNTVDPTNAGFSDDAFFDDTPDPAFDTDTSLDNFDSDDAGFSNDAFFEDTPDPGTGIPFDTAVDDFDSDDAGFSNDAFFADEPLDTGTGIPFDTAVDDFDTADAGFSNDAFFDDTPDPAFDTDTSLDDFDSGDAGFSNDTFFADTPDPGTGIPFDTAVDDFDSGDAGFSDDAFFADEPLDTGTGIPFDTSVDDFDTADAGFSNDTFFADEPLDTGTGIPFDTAVDDFDTADAGFSNDSFFQESDDELSTSADDIIIGSAGSDDFSQTAGDKNFFAPGPGDPDNFGEEDFGVDSEEFGGGTSIDGGVAGGRGDGAAELAARREQSEGDDTPRGSDIEKANNTEVSEDIPEMPEGDAGDNVEVKGAKSAKKSKSNAGLEADLTVEINPRENELDDFGSYTYNVALYMLKPKEYVRLLKSPKSVAQAQKSLLMRNGGTGGDRELAEEFQNTEFFIDDVTFDNIGPNPSTRTGNTNAINIKFNITEPNGCTLIERLKKQSEQSLETDQSYLHTPYLLEVKFKGYDDLGKPSNNIVKPKYIPIKITSLKFSVDAMGTQYRVVAVPYHHDVFSSLRSTIPVNVQVSAGSVGDILNGVAQKFTTEPIREKRFDGPDEGDESTVTVTEVVTGSKDVLGEKAVSLPESVNNHYKAQTRPSKVKDPKTKKERTVQASATVAEEWKFAIADDILNSKLVGASIDALNTTQKTKNVYQQYGSAMKGKINLTKDKKLFKINAGTSVVNLINYIIVASSYVKDNIVTLNQAAANKTKTDTPIKWFKVVPQITDFIGWDKKQGKYKFQITWTVQTTGVFYNDYPWAPKSKPKGEGVHKIYDYIFTGENKHVLECRLDFNMAYYQAATLGTGNPEEDKTPNTMSPQIKEVPQSTQGQNVANDETVEDKRAKDLMSTILHDGTDMISVNLDIIGDPAFLPTGDGFFQPQGNQDKVHSTPFLPDGTINYDLTPPYIQLNFKTPVDYDDVTGFADPNINKKYGTAEFSGVYQVIKVSNNLSGGVFRQSIVAVRAKMQPIKDRVGRSKESLQNENRREFQQDLQKQLLLNVLSGGIRGLPASNIAAKITRAADSSITNIATNVLPKLGQELDQVAQNVIPEVERAGNQMRNFLGTNFPERIAQEIDFQVGFNNNDIDL